MAIPKGSKAPDFTLKSKQASGLVDVKLSNNFGKTNTVLLFFPLAYTSVCTAELCDVTNGLSAFRPAPTSSPSAWTVRSRRRRGRKRKKIRLTLVSDLNKEVTKKYDVLSSDAGRRGRHCGARGVCD